MSRGVKDLRDLICVSRLTIRGSDEEYPLSDEDDGRVSRFFDDRLSSSNTSRESSAKSRLGFRDVQTPDSGISTNGHDIRRDDYEAKNLQAQRPCPPSEPIPSTHNRKKKKKRKDAQKTLETVPSRHDFPVTSPLPPLQNEPDLHSNLSSGSSGGVSPVVEAFSATKTDSTPKSNSKLVSVSRHGTFDELLTYLDATMVAEWLESANSQVADLSKWCLTGENFVDFGHFWLSDFPDMQRYEIFKLEYSILLDHLQLSFTAGRDCGKVRYKDITTFMEAVFREYPGKLISSKGPHLFLDYLDVLSSERQTTYKRLLSDVKCSTRVKEYAQVVLAIRSFALVSMWIAVVNFYRRLLGGLAESRVEGVPQMGTGESKLHHQRMYQSIRKGYVDMVHYLLSTGKVRVNDQDDHGRSLVFNSVMHNRKDVLRYLISNVKPPPDVNREAKSGNTPLHAAANAGHAHLVKVLVKAPGIMVNPTNKKCDNATPLHLAVMHGHKEVVEELLKIKADVGMKMGDLSVQDIARDFGHEDILSLIQ